jgi:hypothetical protein
MTEDEFNYKKEWAYQKKQAADWFAAYQHTLDVMQKLVDELHGKQDFVVVKGSKKSWTRLKSVGGLTLVATWVRDDLVEKEQDT